MEDAEPRWMRTVAWIILGWGVVGLLLQLFGVFDSSTLVVPFLLIFLSTWELLRRTRPRLANVSLTLAGVIVLIDIVGLVTR